ncbi:MAG: hypothetical protein IKU34_00180 [Clostridia bacterium]|nr:hypothetical protein [Clostridia bacterium]
MLPLSFVRFRSVLTTQLSALSFPFFPFSPVGGSYGASFLFRPACFHAFLPIPVLGSLRFLSPFAVSLHSSYFGASAFFLSASGLFPLAFALGSGYSASGLHPFGCIPFVSDLLSAANTSILTHFHLSVNYFFGIFSTFFIFSLLCTEYLPGKIFDSMQIQKDLEGFLLQGLRL